MKTVFTFLLFLMGCLLSCVPEKVDLVPVGTKDTIRNLENRLSRNIGDTCILEKHWFNYFDGKYYLEEYKTVTKVESERRLKANFVWVNKGKPQERLIEGVIYQRAVVVRKY
jgi:hypothetical protein